MRDYAKASPRMWNGVTGKSIRGEKANQILYAYLITCPHANMIGLYHLPIAYIQADTGLSAREARTALERLGGLGFLMYDFDTERIWVVEHWRHELQTDDLKPGDNRGVRAIEQLRVHLGSDLARLFLERYPATKGIAEKILGAGFVKGLSSPSSSPYATPSEAPSEEVAHDARVAGAGTGAGTGASGISAERSRTNGSAPTSDRIVMTFPTTGKGPKEWDLTEAKLAEYAADYPGTDVSASFRRARSWCVNNPAKRKTARGMSAFLTRWLNTEIERGNRGDGRGGPPPFTPPSHTRRLGD